MTPKDIANLPEETKEELRSIPATDLPQEHFRDFKWDAAPGAEVNIHPNRARQARVKADLYENVPDWCDPIPTASEWISGIPHWSENSQVRGQKWDPIRARHSRKFYYLSKLEQIWEAAPDDMPLTQCFPDSNPAAGGLQPLSHVNKRNLFHKYNIINDFALVKHIANMHDGELRQVGEEVWDIFPAPGGNPTHILKPVFWHHQTIQEDGAPK